MIVEGQLASNGYTALADLDSNGDGFITADDVVDVAHEVALDANGDGEITPDEITTEIVQESVFSQLRPNCDGLNIEEDAVLIGLIQ